MKKKLKDAYRVLVNFSETFEMMFLRDNSDYLLRIATLMKDRIDEILGDDDFYYDEEVSIIDSLAITREFLSYVKPEYETDFDNLITQLIMQDTLVVKKNSEQEEILRIWTRNFNTSSTINAKSSFSCLRLMNIRYEVPNDNGAEIFGWEE